MLKSQYLRFFSVSFHKTMKAKVVLLNKKFEGIPKNENFKIVEEELPALKDGEFLAEAEFLSVDPYMRVYGASVGKQMIGDQVAKIIESKNPKYKVGDYVVAEFGWRTHTIGSETPGGFLHRLPKVLEGYGDLPRSLALGVLGMPGISGRFGLFNVCKPVKGNTVVVSGAGGAVGLTVGELAKLEGCRVVGITGSDKKGKRLVKEAGFDAYVNYKADGFETKLAEAVPNLVDCYFDNVGGEVSSAVLYKLNKFARICVCGAISTYSGQVTKAKEVQTPVKVAHATMEGFHVSKYQKEWDGGIEENKKLVKEGKLKAFETVTNGFENTPRAFIELFEGANFGKAVVKV